MALSKSIKVLRTQANISIPEMAERLHIGAEGYRKIERGETALTVDRLNAIAQILGVSKQEIEEFDITEKITFAHTAADYHSIVVTQFN